MKRYFPLILLPILVISACDTREKGYKLHSGTKAYELATDMAKVLPYLDPEQNNPIVTTTSFEISSGDVINNLRSRIGKQATQLRALDAAGMRDAISENGIDLGEKKLLLKEAKNAGFKLNQTKLDSALKVVYESSGNEEIFINKLNKAGITPESVIDEIRTMLTIRDYLDLALADQIQVSEEEILADYKKEKFATVRHLLLRTRAKTDAEKVEIRKKAQELLARAKNGEDFQKMIEKYSEEPGTKKNKGEYTFTFGEMQPEFEEAAFTVAVGQFSDLVETQFGYHIMEIEDRSKDQRPLENVRGAIVAELKANKMEAAFQEYLAKLKKEQNFTLVDF